MKAPTDQAAIVTLMDLCFLRFVTHSTDKDIYKLLGYDNLEY